MEGSVDDKESARRFSYAASYVPKCMVLAARRVSRISRSVSLKSSTRWYIPGPRRASSSREAPEKPLGAGDRGDRSHDSALAFLRVLSACAPTDESTTAVLVTGGASCPRASVSSAPPCLRLASLASRFRRESVVAKSA